MFSQFKKQFLIFSVFWLAASASYFGFFAKHGLRDSVDDTRASLTKMLTGTALKPYVYRQLLPTTANIIGDNLPPQIINYIGDNYHFGPLGDWTLTCKLTDTSAKYKFKWLIIYWMGFALLLGFLYIMRSVLTDFGVSPLAAIFAPCIFSLCMPIFQSSAGYVYDYGELFFMSLAVYLTQRNRPLLLMLVVALATFNKETFVFFIPALYPFLPKSTKTTQTYIFYGTQFLVSLSVNLWIKYIYIGNNGKMAEIWFFKNVKDYLNPLTYFEFEDSYGLVVPKGLNILSLILIFTLIKIAWGYLDQKIQRHCLTAFFINFPLFIVAGFINEIRNLSFLYISLVFLIAYTIQHHERKFDPLAPRGNFI
jgi:hypothetical protein